MSQIKRARPSPAILVAVIALVAALGGSAVAEVATTSKLDKKEKKQVKKLAKKQANKRIDKREPSLNVASAESAGNADELGNVGASEYTQRLYASLNGLGQLQSQSHNATSSTKTGTGAYEATFDRDISQCVWIPSRSSLGTALANGPDVVAASGKTGDPNTVRLRVRDTNGGAPADRSVSLLVVC